MLGNNFLTTDDFEKDFKVGKTVKINKENFEIVGFLEKLGNFQLSGKRYNSAGTEIRKRIHDSFDR